jgi:phenylpyruvate tautomerase PptA (4-oxalocrotonate tautomerase family)
MPLARIFTNTQVEQTAQNETLKTISSILCQTLGKPEKYIMGIFTHSTFIMSETHEPACFVDICSIGKLNPDTNRELSEKICDLIQNKLGVPKERTYIYFQDIPRPDWGWNGTTFG